MTEVDPFMLPVAEALGSGVVGEAEATMPLVALQNGKHEVVIAMPGDITILLLLSIALSMLVATAVAFSWFRSTVIVSVTVQELMVISARFRWAGTRSASRAAKKGGLARPTALLKPRLLMHSCWSVCEAQPVGVAVMIVRESIVVVCTAVVIDCGVTGWMWPRKCIKMWARHGDVGRPTGYISDIVILAKQRIKGVKMRGGLGRAAVLLGMDVGLGVELLMVALTMITEVERTTAEELEPLMVTLKIELEVVRTTDTELELAIVIVSEVVDRLVAVVVEVLDASDEVVCEVVVLKLELVNVLVIEVLLTSRVFKYFPGAVLGATTSAAVNEP